MFSVSKVSPHVPRPDTLAQSIVKQGLFTAGRRVAAGGAGSRDAAAAPAGLHCIGTIAAHCSCPCPQRKMHQHAAVAGMRYSQYCLVITVCSWLLLGMSTQAAVTGRYALRYALRSAGGTAARCCEACAHCNPASDAAYLQPSIGSLAFLCRVRGYTHSTLTSRALRRTTGCGHCSGSTSGCCAAGRCQRPKRTAQPHRRVRHGQRSSHLGGQPSRLCCSWRWRRRSAPAARSSWLAKASGSTYRCAVAPDCMRPSAQCPAGTVAKGEVLNARANTSRRCPILFMTRHCLSAFCSVQARGVHWA